MNILEVKDLRKYFGGIKAVDNVSISFERNKITLIIGPNGSGKTTLVNLITGYIKPDTGRILFYKDVRTNNFIDITYLPPEDRVRLGIVRTFQIPAPFKKLTVLENVLVANIDHPGEKLYNVFIRKKWLEKEYEATRKAFEILKLLNLDHLWNEYAENLSGGQLKLLELARALMLDPRVLLLDEPVGSVNPALAIEILSYIRRLRDLLNITIVMIEHRLDLVIDYVDYVYAMHMGKIIAKGDPLKVLNEPLVIESYIGGERFS